jgi:t-SNARE complex subunit (syntaxin)
MSCEIDDIVSEMEKLQNQVPNRVKQLRTQLQILLPNDYRKKLDDFEEAVREQERESK